MGEAMRKIDVNDKEYTWKVGKSNVLIRDALGASTHVEKYKILGMTREQYEEAINTPITPKHVAAYIHTMKSIL